MNERRDSNLTKRNFLKLAVLGGGALAGLGRLASLHSQTPAANAIDGIPYRTLGRTGERVSLLGLGGYHIGNPSEEEGIRIIRSALDRGVNFLDNCWSYHGGDSEARMGKALQGPYREKAFLMSKIDGQTREAAAAQIDESLRRLQTDHIDLMQFHEIIRLGDPERIFGPGGAAEAMLAAQKAGKVRYIGFTGHKNPVMHMKMLIVASERDFRFDTVQMPLNVMDAHFESFQQRVLPYLLQHGIGVLGMKPLGGGIILKSGAVSPVECLHYAMNLPTSVVITGCDSMKLLDQAIDAARTFHPLTPAQMDDLLARTSSLAEKGEFERYKTSAQFDGTVRHPEWLG